MKTPDLTPAQIVSYLTAIASGLIALFALDLSDGQKAAVIGLIGATVPLAYGIADAIIRHGRATGLGPNRRS
jgi:hypothetical protein